MAYNLGLVPYRNIKTDNIGLEKALPKSSTKERYYIEWWNYGDRADHINGGQFSSANLRHVCKLMLKSQKRTIVYIRRESDNKVIWDHR